MKRSELKKMVLETILTALNEKDTLTEEDYDFEYKRGQTLGKNDKLKGITRELDSNHLPPSFIKGYKETRRDNKWQVWNDRITNWASQLGSSRLRQ